MAGGYCPLFVDARPLRLMCSARFGGDIHASLDAQVDGEHSLLDQLEAPAAELASGSGAEQLPAAQATACGSPCWRAYRCALLGSSWASAPWPCSEPRRKPSQPCACSWWAGAEALTLRPVPSAQAPWLAADRPHHRPQRRRDLQLLFGPVGRQGCQKAASVAVNAEHGVS